jgi:hypothetical protein
MGPTAEIGWTDQSWIRLVEPADDLLSEREITHGHYEQVAKIEQGLKAIIRAGPNWNKMEPCAQSSLEHWCTKVARALCGQWDYIDHWDDMSGYRKLTHDILQKKAANRHP